MRPPWPCQPGTHPWAGPGRSHRDRGSPYDSGSQNTQLRSPHPAPKRPQGKAGLVVAQSRPRAEGGGKPGLGVGDSTYPVGPWTVSPDTEKDACTQLGPRHTVRPQTGRAGIVTEVFTPPGNREGSMRSQTSAMHTQTRNRHKIRCRTHAVRQETSTGSWSGRHYTHMVELWANIESDLRCQ